MWCGRCVHKISKFFLRLEDILNGEDRRYILFDIETQPVSTHLPFNQMGWEEMKLEEILEMDGVCYHMLSGKITGGKDHGTLLH